MKQEAVCTEVLIDLADEVEKNFKLQFRLSGNYNNDVFLYEENSEESLKEFFEEIFKKSASNVEWVRFGRVPRAKYEQQAFLFEGIFTFSLEELNKKESFAAFVEEFSRSTECLLHDQAFLEFPEFVNLFPKIIPHNVDVPVTTIALGNCPNPGLFFVRGDYITNLNAICSLCLYPPGSDISKESPTFKVAGKNSLLSYGKFEHDRRQMSLYFGMRLAEIQADGLEYAGYRLSMYYSSFVKIIVDTSCDKTNSLFIQLKHPPQLWEAIPKNCTFHPSKARVLNMETCMDWIRVLCWSGDADNRGWGCSSNALAQSSWLRLVFPKDNQSPVTTITGFLQIVARITSRCSAKVFFGSIFSMRRKLAPVPIIKSVGVYKADYAIAALFTRGSVVTDQLFDAIDNGEDGVLDVEKEPLFLKYVRVAIMECPRACVESLEQLLNALDERRSVDVFYAFRSLYVSRKNAYVRALSGEKIQDTGLTRPLPKNCVVVPKVMVTPTRVLLMAPEVMMTNRVLRKFGPEYALRCVFRDDSSGRAILRDFSLGNIDNMSNILAEIIYNILKNGITVAGRCYQFLAWSNSQMRDQGCYMYAAKVDPTTGAVSGSVEQIREWMGDFRNATSVPKMMSRMGQCFTQAQPTIKLESRHWTVIDDIIGGKGGNYCFSDGCGKISFKLAWKISKILKLEAVPACYQIRFKGFKGILVIDPLLDYMKEVPKIMFRKSQQKFQDGTGSQMTDYLEVVKYAIPSPVCLNRPFITILDHVSEKQSIESHKRICARVNYYLERELSSLCNMLINEKSAAEELSNRTNLPINFVNVSARSGFRMTVDPFIRKMILSIYRYSILHHISKAKIFLPGNAGRSMFGVVDETGVLQYGQVFIQWSQSLRKTSYKPNLVLGKVLITKNPCHVPGDARIFDAVYQPCLKHLVDVVVFPQSGPRPHPDEMAGSDLDGDEYSIFWDQEMLFDYNEKAMVYPNHVAPDEEKEPTTDDMVDFFLKYLQQDSIGRMSNAHLIAADVKGLFHEISNSIALKCAVAVDFPKSGIPAEPLANHEQCDVTPDYMAALTKPMYYSSRLNGQLYRKARKVEEILEEYEKRGSVYEGEYDRLICPDNLDVFAGSQKALFETIRIRDEYARRMQQLLDEYGIEGEASVVSGHASVIKRLAGMERDDYSFYHTDKVVELRYTKIYQSFRNMFFEDFGGEDANTVTENEQTFVRTTPAMMEKVRQWYYVCIVLPLHEGARTPPCQSMPWVAWEALMDLRRKLMMESEVSGESLKYPIAERLMLEIQKSIAIKKPIYNEFLYMVNVEEDAFCVLKYSQVYGEPLKWLVFILNEWLIKESVLPREGLNIWHVARLLIQFALGLLHGTPMDYEKRTMIPIFGKTLSAIREEPKMFETFDYATLLIDFIHYLSSQSFLNSNVIKLRVFEDQCISEPTLFRKSQWKSIHNTAYRAFHSLAISGRFDVLNLSEELYDEQLAESRDPILVHETVFNSKNYGVVPLSRFRVIECLKTWSGVDEIIPRENTGRRTDLIYVTSVGSAVAKQRLARLLLLNPETLRNAILNDTIPLEVRDDSL